MGSNQSHQYKPKQTSLDEIWKQISKFGKRKKKALVLGIDKYPQRPLNGCVNDAKAWARELTRRGYCVITYLNDDVTWKKVSPILEEVDLLVFCGHGNVVENACCVKLVDCYVPIYNLVIGVKKGVFSDCCFSGSMNAPNAQLNVVPANYADLQGYALVNPPEPIIHTRLPSIRTVNNNATANFPAVPGGKFLFSAVGSNVPTMEHLRETNPHQIRGQFSFLALHKLSNAAPEKPYRLKELLIEVRDLQDRERVWTDQFVQGDIHAQLLTTDNQDYVI